ncbi:MAG: efflux RND transporter periplasmic adaptor subunit [Pseudomonadales bacterium]
MMNNNLRGLACLLLLGIFSWPSGASVIEELDCIIEPEMTIELSTSVDGIVDSVAVDKSDRVKKGQVLAQLEASVEQAAVAVAAAQAKMDDDIRAKQVNKKFADRKKRRAAELFEKKVGSSYDKDEAETEARLAQLALEQAHNDKKLAQLELQRAEAALKLRTVTSPAAAIVVDRYVHPGESVKDKPLLKLAQIDPLRIEIIAPSELYGSIQPGMQAEIFPEAPANDSYLATVSVVDNIIDAASGTFGIRLTLPNPDYKVVGGLKCRANFDSQR